MSIKGAGRRELSQLVPHHVFGHKNRKEFFPVVNRKGQSHKFRQDGGSPRPSLYNLAALCLIGVRGKTVPPSWPSCKNPVTLLAFLNDQSVTGLPDPGFVALGRNTPGCDGMPPP